MLQYLVYVIFILSVALAAGGIVLASRLKNKYTSGFISSLLYFQVFIFTFGFYGIWGNVIIKAFLSPFLTPDLLIRFSDISMLLGLPFLVFAWLMFIKFSFEISGRRFSNWNLIWFLLLNFSILLIVGYFIAKIISIRPVDLIRYYFIIMNFIYSLSAALLIIIKGKNRSEIHEYDKRILSFGILLVMIIQCMPLLFFTNQNYIGILFIFTFFAGNAFLPVYFSYGTLLPAFARQPGKDLSFEEFCKKFEVSPRESDIVREICNGLSNKEISEVLFISLQTVKDHTHRIYIKTNVKSRVQLINLVKEEMGS
jgi:DNA-binding CsgD family transcriptional regulator